MTFLKRLFWLLLATALMALAVYLTSRSDVADRLTNLFLQAQPYLPLSVDFTQFLVGLAVLSVLIVLTVLAGCAGILIVVGGRLSRQSAQVMAARKEVAHIADAHLRHYEQLVSIGQSLAKRLDKRVLLQGIVEAASKLTSVSQANSIASCWLLQFETETMRLEASMYCDETSFTRTECQLTEQPFAHVISTQQPWILPSWPEGIKLMKPAKMSQLGSATSLLVIPLVVEQAVLGVLLLCCHPDIVKSYAEQEVRYRAFWSELALALAIAVQGEVAIFDRLTGAHNREYFLRRLIEELERANRYQLPLSLLMIDIDNFKAVNDTLGHPQGDAVLKIIAKLIRKGVRAIDLIGRYGGEEFIVMLPETGYTDETTSERVGALVVAERIRQFVDEEFRGMQKPLNLTVSIGVAVRRFPEDRAWDHRDLVRVADEQLYRAKASGKNKVCVATPPNPQAVS